jgi:hypothetical protein
MNRIPIGIHELVESTLYVREGGDEGPAISMRNRDDHGISIGNHVTLFFFDLFFAFALSRFSFSPFLSNIGHVETKSPFMMGAGHRPMP